MQDSPVYFSKTYLAVAEETSSLNDVHAYTKIFELHTIDQYPASASLVQTIKSRPVFSIQSVYLQNGQALLMLLNSDFVNVYGASMTKGIDCDDLFSIRTSVPTKGAKKMITLQNIDGTTKTMDNCLVGKDHFLILSKEECDRSAFTTKLLRSRFDY